MVKGGGRSLKKCFRLPVIITSFLLGAVILVSVVLAILSRVLVYQPNSYNAVEVAAALAADQAIREIFIEAGGIRLHGYTVRNEVRPDAPWIVFFGGQGDDVFRYTGLFRRLAGCNIVMCEYRGYGLSGGEPSERVLMDDGLAVFDHVRRNLAGPAAPVYAMGFSLGTGVAVNLAAYRPVDGLVLVAPYDSVRRVAGNYFPEFILSLFLHEDYDSISRIGSVHCPLLVIATSGDRVVPFHHTQILYERGPQPKSLIIVPNVTHTTILSSDQCFYELGHFLQEKAPGPGPAVLPE